MSSKMFFYKIIKQPKKEGGKMKKRTYPCRAIFNTRNMPRHPKLIGVEFPDEIEVFVLSEARIWSCSSCGFETHKVLLPENYPEPPNGCDAWLISPGRLIFED